MKSATKYFEISYSRDREELVGEISGTLFENMERIKEFFRLEKLEDFRKSINWLFTLMMRLRFFVSIQMYGIIFIFPKGKCTEGYYISSRSKIDSLCDEFTFEYFRSLYPGNHKKLNAKAFLATEQRIRGLGNGVLQDILWDVGINPRFDMRESSETDFMVLYNSVRKILKEIYIV